MPLSKTAFSALIRAHVERSRERAAGVEAGIPKIFVRDGGHHGGGDPDRRNPGGKDAGALCRHVALCVDGADRGDFGVARGGILSWWLAGRSVAKIKPVVYLHRSGGGVS